MSLVGGEVFGGVVSTTVRKYMLQETWQLVCNSSCNLYVVTVLYQAEWLKQVLFLIKKFELMPKLAPMVA